MYCRYKDRQCKPSKWYILQMKDCPVLYVYYWITRQVLISNIYQYQLVQINETNMQPIPLDGSNVVYIEVYDGAVNIVSL